MIAAAGLVEAGVLAAYFAVLSVLAVFGVHRLYLVCLYLWSRRRAPVAPDAPSVWPRVTVQLPVFNELYVVERLLQAVARLEYPRDRLEVQVLDDSTDETADRVAALVQRLSAAGLRATHLHRQRREGYKAGALQAGLDVSAAELVCIFDADFVPTPEFLRRTVPYFVDPKIGMVQVRWGHLNAGSSWLTRVQAMLLDAHFAIEQAARSWSGRFFNFNGTAGVWRRRAIEDAGGWQHDTLTEDLDLSYRAQLAGWRFLYVDQPVAPAELPVSIEAFKSQQRRWTQGAVQTARKLLGPLWRSDVALPVKLEGTFHMTANASYPLMIALSLLVFPAMLLRLPYGSTAMWLVDVPVLACATGSVCVFYVMAQREIGRSWTRAVVSLPPLMALGIGISLNNTLAVLAGLRGRGGEFVRTPKYAADDRSADDLPTGWADRAYRARRPAGLAAVEVAMAGYFTGAVLVAIALQMWVSLPILLLFQGGYAYVAWLSWSERRVVPVAAAHGVG